jgi:hypothetical protein
MSGGGGKGGGKTTTTETTVPNWIRDPAARNLQRAEAVQQLEYMPYYGPQVAAFTDTQNAAMNNNIETAKAFGLLDPNSSLTATSGMPTPTTYDNGMRGYSSIPLYDQALAELTASNPDNMAAYNSLFGNQVAPINFGRQGGGGGGGFRGGASPITTDPVNRWVDKAAHIMDTQDKERDRGTPTESGVKQAQDYYTAAKKAGTEWDKPRGYTPAEAKKYTANAKAHTDTQGTIMKWPQKAKKKKTPTNVGNPFGYR